MSIVKNNILFYCKSIITMVNSFDSDPKMTCALRLYKN